MEAAPLAAVCQDRRVNQLFELIDPEVEHADKSVETGDLTKFHSVALCCRLNTNGIAFYFGRVLDGLFKRKIRKA
jgi:hypothetical protein